MNKIGFGIDNSSRNINSLYVECRSEDRFGINLLDGLSSLGHTSYGINRNIRQPFQLKNNFIVTSDRNIKLDHFFLFSNWNRNHFNVNTTWFMTHNFGYYDAYKHLFSTYNNNKYLCTPMSTCLKTFNQNGIPIKFVPTVFPLPSYHIGFKPFCTELKTELRLFVQDYVRICESSHWVLPILKEVCGYLTKIGFSPTLIVQTNFDEKYKNFGFPVEIVSGLIAYDKIYNLIELSDLGIVFGDGGSASGSQFDFLSLGKAILFFSNGDVGDEYVSPLYNRKDLMWIYDPANLDFTSLSSYLECTLDNIESVYTSMIETVSDYHYDNWKLIMADLFN